MTEVIIGILGVLSGISIIALAVYNRFFNSFVPNPKKWKRARAKIIGRNRYQVRNISKYGGSPYRECFEKSIAYTVDGKSYKKYVDDTENGAVHIYYNIKNPNRIKTMSEIRQRKYEGRNNASFAGMVFTGAVVIIFSISVFALGIKEIAPF